MNNPVGYVRVNITMPVDIVTKVKKVTREREFSKFITEAAEEKLYSKKREEAIMFLRDAPPTHTHIKDSAAYVKKVRSLDKKRTKRLGI